MNYYESKDLDRFGEIGQFRGELAEKFFDYYNAVTGEDGALTKREKALIALAVAHAKQCPYCIDAYTTQCLENGANPDEMTEAVHVAAVMEAGMTLVHGVQMHNALRKRRAKGYARYQYQTVSFHYLAGSIVNLSLAIASTFCLL
jgi:alkylhydroperoxidase/carboxymuconolactone decarboxylase family protein